MRERTDHFDDELGAVCCGGEGLDCVEVAVLAMVDCVMRAHSLHKLKPLRRARRRNHRKPCGPSELDRGHADCARAPVHEDHLAGPSVRALRWRRWWWSKRVSSIGKN